jgi:hypothetical protein
MILFDSLVPRDRIYCLFTAIATDRIAKKTGCICEYLILISSDLFNIVDYTFILRRGYRVLVLVSERYRAHVLVALGDAQFLF